MSDNKDVLAKLKLTPKGQLNYDRYWQGKEGINKVLNECASPPAISRSPQSDKTPEQKSNKHEGIKNSGSLSTMSPSSPGLELSISAMAAEKRLRMADKAASDKAKAELAATRWKFEREEERVIQQAQSQLYQLYFTLDSKAQEALTKARDLQKAGADEAKKKASKLQEDHRRHARILDEKMKEAHRLQKEDENRRIQRQEESAARLKKMGDMLANVKRVHSDCEQLLAACTHPHLLCDATKKSPGLIIQLYERIKSEMNSSQHAAEVSEESVRLTSAAVEQADKIHRLLNKQVAEANKQAKDAADKEEKAKQEEKKKQEDEMKKKKEAAAAAAAKVAAKSPSQTVVKGSDQCVTAVGQQVYERVMASLQNAVKEYEPLLNDPQFKRMKLSIQKPIVTAINTISAASMDNLRLKARQLCQVLGGGGPAGNNTAALMFCKELLAKKVVRQGDEQISSNHESAFGIAFVVVFVMNQYPDVTDLLLAHLFTKCPYLIPYYLPKKQGQTEEEYYTSLGYTYSNGELEKQDKFLRRMSGIMRLYAAILVTPDSPHRLDQGWQWLVSIVSLDPRPLITASLLFDFLEVTGNSMLQAYGKQFLKLLRCIGGDYMAKVRQVSQSVGGPAVGTVHKLEEFIQKVLRTGHIPAPPGMLSRRF